MKVLYRNLIMIFCLGVLASTAFAQAKEDFRKTQPKPLATRAFSMAKPYVTTLPNGLKVIIAQDKRLPIVSARLIFKSGDVNDPKGLNGLTGMMTSLLKEGTSTRTSAQIAKEVEQIGGAINAGSSADTISISANSLSQYADRILPLMADVALNPSFPQNEIDLAVKNTIQGLEFQRSQPDFLSSEQLNRIVWGDNAYGTPAPTKENISAITRDKLVDMHSRAFVPNNAVLLIAGDVDPAKVMPEVTKLFGNWKKGTPLKANFVAPPTRTSKSLTIVNREGSQQSNILMGNVAITRRDPDFFPLLVMNQIYGGGASSRLFMNLREDKGYTYGAYSSTDFNVNGGTLESSAEVRNEVTGASLKEIFAEMDKIRNTPVSAKELADVKSYLTGVFPIGLETMDGMLGSLSRIEINSLPADYLQTYRDKINAVTAADVQRVAQKYITPEKIAAVIVGDAGEILKQSKPYFTDIEVVDVYGKKLDPAAFAENANSDAPVNPAGKWTLSVDAMGQQLPFSLEIKQDGDKLSGELGSPMTGTSAVEDIKLSGNKITASSKVSFQGQTLTLKISGTISGDKIKGTVDIGMPGAPPFAFSGTRAK